jgi:hypothetical protein
MTDQGLLEEKKLDSQHTFATFSEVGASLSLCELKVCCKET